MQRLIIIRGISGSGKTSEANRIMKANPDEKFQHVEADMFFEDDEGNYNFDPKLLPSAHKWCYDNIKKGLEHGYSSIVSNTFTRKWEYESYVKMAEELKVPYEIVTMKGKYQNTHGVPEEVVKQMESRWEE